MPAKLTILGHEITVYCENPKEWADDGLGRADYGKGVVRLSSQMSDDALCCVFLHELIHLTTGCISDLKLSETQIDIVASGLYTFLQKHTNYKATVLALVRGEDQ